MNDFANWCVENDMVDVLDDGTVVWRESGGVRDMRTDLEDYINYCHRMGIVWPFKLKAGKGKGKTAAPVGK